MLLVPKPLSRRRCCQVGQYELLFYSEDEDVPGLPGSPGGERWSNEQQLASNHLLFRSCQMLARIKQ